MTRTIPAPQNPYRAHTEEATTGWHTAALQPPMMMPRQHDTEAGPGLLADDLDRMTRAHFADGFAAANRDAEEKILKARGQLASAYDQGYTRGVETRTREFAKDMHTRLLGQVHFAVLALEQGPKAKRDEAIARVRASVNDVIAYAQSVAENEGVADAVAGLFRIAFAD